MRSFFRDTFIGILTVLLITLGTTLLMTFPFLEPHPIVVAAFLGIEFGQKLKAFISSKVPV